MHWTERYNASSLELGEDGWRMGVAQDVRLNRSVFLAVRKVHRDERSIIEQWLATRSAFSHEYVADVLDCVFSEDELACVFLMPSTFAKAESFTPKERLLTRCLSVIEGAESLWRAGLPVTIRNAQVLWDQHVGPQMLALLPTHLPTLKERVRSVRVYLSHLLRLHGAACGMTAESIERFEHSSIQEDETLSDLKTSLFDLFQVDPLQTLRSALNPSEDTLSRNADMQFQDTIEVPIIVQRMMEADAEKKAREHRDRAIAAQTESMNESTVERTLPFAAKRKLLRVGFIVFVLAVLVLSTGIWISQNLGQQSAVNQTSTGTISHALKPQSPHALHMPDLKNATLHQAMARLQALGIPASHIHVLSQAGPSQRVVNTTPQAGQSLVKTTPVTLYVGIAQGQILVPSLLGMSYAQAVSVLSARHIHYSYTLQGQSKIASSVVLSQHPMPHGAMQSSASLTFTLGTKP
ncbi:PASTA domain-containing protein [Ferroacidibacillus organovorans]|uniref:PASTA domain-containing protein n=1 Tax=Ferroacidibacillus organovorans TaxID=1765683 RepID=A0A853KDY1_9BACL|nr:PASTA domain-containing protein [Ferroacidibacillus organovorans]KYP82126.1 hypothetical protein AYJ22_00280 [Ferroacidibacillus organovorans]OAG94409.1 hypothetical protein AYW79_05170 [Ferroacidibacillus organovorans]